MSIFRGCTFWAHPLVVRIPSIFRVCVPSDILGFHLFDLLAILWTFSTLLISWLTFSWIFSATVLTKLLHKLYLYRCEKQTRYQFSYCGITLSNTWYIKNPREKVTSVLLSHFPTHPTWLWWIDQVLRWTHFSRSKVMITNTSPRTTSSSPNKLFIKKVKLWVSASSNSPPTFINQKQGTLTT